MAEKKVNIIDSNKLIHHWIIAKPNYLKEVKKLIEKENARINER